MAALSCQAAAGGGSVRAGGGKEKGSGFERECCVKLSMWVSGGTHKDLFWRSAMSGGRATVAAKKGDKLNRQAGDVCSVSEEGHSLTNRYYIECKSYKDLEIDSFLLVNRGQLARFWKDTVKHSKTYSKTPMLIAKENRRPTLILSSWKGLPLKQRDHLALVMPPSCDIALFETLLATTWSPYP